MSLRISSWASVRRLFLRIRDGDRDEILEHLDVRRIHDARVELDRAHLPLPVGVTDTMPPPLTPVTVMLPSSS